MEKNILYFLLLASMLYLKMNKGKDCAIGWIVLVSSLFLLFRNGKEAFTQGLDEELVNLRLINGTQQSDTYDQITIGDATGTVTATSGNNILRLEVDQALAFEVLTTDECRRRCIAPTIQIGGPFNNISGGPAPVPQIVGDDGLIPNPNIQGGANTFDISHESYTIGDYSGSYSYLTSPDSFGGGASVASGSMTLNFLENTTVDSAVGPCLTGYTGSGSGPLSTLHGGAGESDQGGYGTPGDCVSEAWRYCGLPAGDGGIDSSATGNTATTGAESDIFINLISPAMNLITAKASGVSTYKEWVTQYNGRQPGQGFDGWFDIVLADDGSVDTTNPRNIFSRYISEEEFNTMKTYKRDRLGTGFDRELTFQNATAQDVLDLYNFYYNDSDKGTFLITNSDTDLSLGNSTLQNAGVGTCNTVNLAASDFSSEPLTGLTSPDVGYGCTVFAIGEANDGDSVRAILGGQAREANLLLPSPINVRDKNIYLGLTLNNDFQTRSSRGASGRDSGYGPASYASDVSVSNVFVDYAGVFGDGGDSAFTSKNSIMGTDISGPVRSVIEITNDDQADLSVPTGGKLNFARWIHGFTGAADISADFQNLNFGGAVINQGEAVANQSAARIASCGSPDRSGGTGIGSIRSVDPLQWSLRPAGASEEPERGGIAQNADDSATILHKHFVPLINGAIPAFTNLDDPPFYSRDSIEGQTTGIQSQNANTGKFIFDYDLSNIINGVDCTADGNRTLTITLPGSLFKARPAQEQTEDDEFTIEVILPDCEPCGSCGDNEYKTKSGTDTRYGPDDMVPRGFNCCIIPNQPPTCGSDFIREDNSPIPPDSTTEFYNPPETVCDSTGCTRDNCVTTCTNGQIVGQVNDVTQCVDPPPPTCGSDFDSDAADNSPIPPDSTTEFYNPPETVCDSTGCTRDNCVTTCTNGQIVGQVGDETRCVNQGNCDNYSRDGLNPETQYINSGVTCAGPQQDCTQAECVTNCASETGAATCTGTRTSDGTDCANIGGFDGTAGTCPTTDGCVFADEGICCNREQEWALDVIIWYFVYTLILFILYVISCKMKIFKENPLWEAADANINAIVFLFGVSIGGGYVSSKLWSKFESAHSKLQIDPNNSIHRKAFNNYPDSTNEGGKCTPKPEGNYFTYDWTNEEYTKYNRKQSKISVPINNYLWLIFAIGGFMWLGNGTGNLRKIHTILAYEKVKKDGGNETAHYPFIYAIVALLILWFATTAIASLYETETEPDPLHEPCAGGKITNSNNDGCECPTPDGSDVSCISTTASADAADAAADDEELGDGTIGLTVGLAVFLSICVIALLFHVFGNEDK